MLIFLIKDSSAIENVSYDCETKELFITFNKGLTTYTYYNVPVETVLDLCSSESLGKAFHKLIKNKYEFKMSDIISLGEVG